MRKRWQQYKELELIANDHVQMPKSLAQCPALPWFKRLWNAFDAALFRSLEPRVWQTVDAQTGQSCWHFYDPDTGKTSQLNSEAELRLWLQWLFEQSP